MKPLPPAIRRRVLLRTLTVQASWNYHTLIGTGFAFLLIPGLRFLCRDDPVALQAAVSRHARLFNSHPYLASIAAGAVLRLEATRADPETIERFKAALRGSLGSLGDQLFWSAWRPMCALLGTACLLAGAPWWVAVLAFLIPYNALHLGVRVWGFGLGLERGRNIGAALRQSFFPRWTERFVRVGAALAGFCGVLAAGMGSGTATALAVIAAALLAGLLLGARVRIFAALALAVAWALVAAAGINF